VTARYTGAIKKVLMPASGPSAHAHHDDEVRVRSSEACARVELKR
jgi:hypothetical protein